MSSLEKALPNPKIELYSGKYFAACGLGGIIGEPLSPAPISSNKGEPES
jgi:hypothetical protein